jgi:hypothetical protein
MSKTIVITGASDGIKGFGRHGGVDLILDADAGLGEGHERPWSLGRLGCDQLRHRGSNQGQRHGEGVQVKVAD